MVALSVLTYSRANSEIISAQTKHVHKLWVIAKACTGFSLFNSVRCNFIRSFSRIKLSGCLLTYRNFEDTGLCNTSMILLSHCVNPLKWAYRKSIIPLELTVKPSFQAVEDKTPFSYWENFDSSFFFPHKFETGTKMEGGCDQEFCLAASPKRTYLFHPAVHSLLQPSGSNRKEESFFTFSYLSPCNMKFCRHK